MFYMMKNLITCLVLIGAIILLLCATSCSKEPIQPTCFRYLEMVDHYDGQRNYQYTDTLWPNGRYNNVVCGADVDKMRLHVDAFEGCVQGWFVVRYKVEAGE
jgi:hypothetical protein